MDNKPIEGQDYNGAIDGINARVYTNDPAEVARFEKGHRAVVEDALAAGKPVPAEVLADYQDLAPTPGPAAAEAAPAGEDPRTSLQNAVVDKERLERGLAPLAPALRESWPESMAGALEEVGKNPKRPQELVANLATNPRPVSVHEEALIAIYKVQIRTDRGRISAEAEEAHRRGDTDALIDAQRRLALNEADMATTDLTTKVTGTAGARAFRFRAAMVAEDFSVEAMQTERRILNDFEPLSPEQLAEIDVLQAKIQAAEAAVAVAEERTRVAEAKRETYQIRRKGRPAAAVTEEARQRAKDRVASIDAEIASLKTDISRRLQGKGEGNIELRGAGLPLDTPTLGKMARLGYLYTKKGFVKFEAWSKAMLDSLGEDVRPHLDSLWLQIHQMAPEPAKEWKVNAARATRLTRQIEDYTGRIEARDYETRAKPELVEPSQEVLDLRYEAEKLKADWQLGNWKLKQSRRTLPQRTVDELLDLLPSAVTLRTAFDISGSGRQGGFVFTSHPIRSLKPFGHQFQAMTEKGYFDRTAKLRADSEYSDAVAAGIDFSEYGVLQAGTHTEEQLRGRLAQLIPGVRASSRAYVTFLNDLRLTYFKLLRHALPTDGRGTKQELNLLANLVNVATGRGTVKGHDQAIAAAARYFWAPRLAISRFQLTLLHPLWKGPWKGTWAARKIIAKEYLRYELGRRVLYALLTLAFMPAGMEVEWDPRSSAWGKIPVNNKFLSLLTVLGVGVQSYDGKMYLDPLAGASQAVVFMARMIAGETKTGRGEIRALRGDENRYGWQDVPKTIFNFGWGKLSPIPSTVISLAAGKNPVGDPINLQTSQGLKNTLRGLATPLVVDDIYEAFTNEPE
ncbi:MAG: hypothetical protein IMZ50_13145 [Candidatus Atribacteria bacterium]|nr:hypothetical protein [Candidatus Atribacteria bacterium]